jgi:sulfate permease, SulP family
MSRRPNDSTSSESGVGERAGDVYGRDGSPFQAPAERSVLNRVSPFTARLSRYERAMLPRDVVAGLTVSALAIPSAIAYAELAGVPPVAGLYALLLPTVAYAFIGSSRQLIVGPEGSIAALVAAAVLPVAGGDASRYASVAALLAIVVGCIFLVARVVRLGWVADYFSRPVLTGYIQGVAVVIIIAQLPKLLGLDIAAEDPLPRLAEVVREIAGLSGVTIAVSAACLIALLGLQRVSRRIPAALFVVVVAIAISAGADLASHGVAVVGVIPSGLPAVALPDVRWGDSLALLPAAIGIFLVSFADQILTARSFAGKHGQHVRADQELLAMGVANLGAGITRAFPIGASGSRTAVNDDTGARTQLAGLVAALGVAIVLLFLTAPVRYLPTATLGAVIVAAAIGLIDPKAWAALARTSRVELVIAAVTAVGVVLVGVLEALIVAVALSVVDVVRRSAAPHDAVLGWDERIGRYADIRVHPRARVTPGVLVYRLDDRLFFANASYVRGRIAEAIDGAPDRVRWFVFDAESLSHLDDTGAHAIKELIASLNAEEVVFVVARLKSHMEGTFEDFGLLDLVGRDHLYPTVRAAVESREVPGGG